MSGHSTCRLAGRVGDRLAALKNEILVLNGSRVVDRVCDIVVDELVRVALVGGGRMVS